MLEITFDTLMRTQVFISGIDARLQDTRRLWTDFIAPFVWDEIDDIFEDEGPGWPPLSPAYAARKASAYPGKGILEREGTYRAAATAPNRPGGIYDVSPTELVVGVSGSVVPYAQFHEEGTANLPARPVYDLIAAGSRFEERVSQISEKWQSEEIERLERGFR